MLLHFMSETEFFLLSISTPESLCTSVCVLYKCAQSYRCLPGYLVWGYRWPLEAVLPKSGTQSPGEGLRFSLLWDTQPYYMRARVLMPLQSSRNFSKDPWVAPQPAYTKTCSIWVPLLSLNLGDQCGPEVSVIAPGEGKARTGSQRRLQPIESIPSWTN